LDSDLVKVIQRVASDTRRSFSSTIEIVLAAWVKDVADGNISPEEQDRIDAMAQRVADTPKKNPLSPGVAEAIKVACDHPKDARIRHAWGSVCGSCGDRL
jgi:hypothetical protein